MADLRLRRASPADLDAVGRVTVAAYEPFLVGPDDPYRAELAAAERRHDEAQLWVATPPGSEQVLGAVTICPEGSPWREVARPGEGEFRMLAVDPTARRRGVGEALAQLALDLFRAEGASGVALSSLEEMTEAHRLYARLGFVRTPDRDWRPRPDISLICFRKSLED